jgi:hypothetical protein
MTEADELRRSGVETVDPVQDEQMSEETRRRRQELIVFWDAGVLSDSELEEQMVKLRWNLP